MILEKLLVNNFGVYAGKQNFNLSPDKKKPVILIGALNGSGKTTFLQAVDFVLYGKQSNIFQNSKLSYENFLKKNINKENYEEGAQIELAFFRKIKGKTQKFKLSRNWKPTGNKVKEDFFVFIDGEYDEDITKDWDNYVDQILPARVASLFFFDGEKIEQLADLDKSKEVLKKAINSLLGLEVVDQLGNDVDEFRKRSSIEMKTDDEKDKIDELEKKAENLDIEIKQIQEDLTREEDELTKNNYEKQQLDIELSKKGYDYYEKRKDFEKELKLLNDDKNKEKDELIKIVSGDGPLLLVQNEIQEILDQSKKIADQKNLNQISDVKKTLINDANQFVEENCDDKEFIKKFQNYLNAKNTKEGKINKQSHLLENLNYQDLQLLLEKQLPDLQSVVDESIKKINKIEEEYEKKVQLINKIPTDDTIQPLVEKQKKLHEDKLKLITKINVLNDLRSRKNGPLIQINIELRKLYDEKSNQDIINLDKRRFVDYSTKVKDILSSFHVKVLDHHIKKLEKYILESFNNIHRKKDFVKSIKIDTTTFDLKIYEKKNIEIDTDKLSAGERQLLAVAILWGLARASKSTAPTIIDTPLGRLDSEHRLNLVEQYFPAAAKQVILLSTDEEINQKYHKYIKPYLSRSYKVEYDQKINGSKLQEGYFF